MSSRSSSRRLRRPRSSSAMLVLLRVRSIAAVASTMLPDAVGTTARSRFVTIGGLATRPSALAAGSVPILRRIDAIRGIYALDQPEFLDLRCAHRPFVDEVHVARNLEARDVPDAETHDVAGRDLRAFAQLDECRRYFLEPRVR